MGVGFPMDTDDTRDAMASKRELSRRLALAYAADDSDAVGALCGEQRIALLDALEPALADPADETAAIRLIGRLEDLLGLWLAAAQQLAMATADQTLLPVGKVLHGGDEPTSVPAAGELRRCMFEALASLDDPAS